MNSAQPLPPRIEATGSNRWWIGLSLLAGLCAAFTLFSFNPSNHSFYPVCQFHSLTGLNCPGCGVLRGTHHLLHGEVLAALRHNAMLVLGIPLVSALLALRLWRARSGNSLDLSLKPSWVIWFGIVTLLFTILRNIPAWPFNLLSP